MDKPAEKVVQAKGVVKANQVVSIGQLVSLDWVFGVAVKSSQVDQLNSPYVQLQLRVADPNDKVTQHHIELTLPEFQVCLVFFSLFLL